MLVNTPRVYKMPNLSLMLENILRRQNNRKFINMIHKDRIYLVIRNRNKAEFSICVMSKSSLYRFLLTHSKLLLNVNCGVEVINMCMQ